MARTIVGVFSFFVLVAAAMARVTAQPTPAAEPNNVDAPPETEIYVAGMVLDGGAVFFGAPTNVTNHQGYDNQPYFLPSGDAILYTSEGADYRMDAWKLDLTTGERTQLTNTPNNSEYSPKLMPDGSGISVIFEQENRGGQQVRRYLTGETEASDLMTDVSPVGYHAWGQGTRYLALFALGDPSTLRLVDREAGTVEIKHENIGRALYALPDGSGYTFTERLADDRFQVLHLDIESGTVSLLFELPGANEHYALMANPDAPMGVSFVSANDSKLYFRNSAADEWHEVADFAEQGINTITRLAVSPKLNRIAFVVR